VISRFEGRGFQFAAATEAVVAVAAAAAAAAVAEFAAAEDTVCRTSNLQSAAEAFAVHPTGS
jgi:hypothetical protein